MARTYRHERYGEVSLGTVLFALQNRSTLLTLVAFELWAGFRVNRDRVLWLVLRVTLAGLIAAHGWARFVQGGVAPFGGWLQSQGVAFGFFVAWVITLFEIAGSVVFAAGRFVWPLSIMFSAIYLVGIVLVHAKAGWFVVGLGRNGMEFSVLLIVCLLCVGWAHRKR